MRFDFYQLELKFINIARIHYNRLLRMYFPGLLKNVEKAQNNWKILICVLKMALFFGLGGPYS